MRGLICTSSPKFCADSFPGNPQHTRIAIRRKDAAATCSLIRSIGLLTAGGTTEDSPDLRMQPVPTRTGQNNLIESDTSTGLNALPQFFLPMSFHSSHGMPVQ